MDQRTNKHMNATDVADNQATAIITVDSDGSSPASLPWVGGGLRD